LLKGGTISGSGVIAKRPAPIALPNSCAAWMANGTRPVAAH